MSTTQTPSLPTPQAAFDNVLQLAQRVFFQKCAQAGFSPRNSQEAEMMMNAADNLYAVDQAAQVKAAAAGNDPLSAIFNASTKLAEQYGVKSAAAAEANGALALGNQLAQDPTLYNSVLALKSAEADDAHVQYQEWLKTQPQR